MKLTYFSLLLFISNSAFAGGSGGGGGVRPEERTINPQTIADFGSRIKTDPTIRIIHGTPSINGVSRLSVGRIEKNQWQIQEFDVPSDLLLNSDLSQEIQESIDLNDWVEIKN